MINKLLNNVTSTAVTELQTLNPYSRKVFLAIKVFFNFDVQSGGKGGLSIFT